MLQNLVTINEISKISSVAVIHLYGSNKGSQISSTSHQELLKCNIAFHTIHTEESISFINF